MVMTSGNPPTPISLNCKQLTGDIYTDPGRYLQAILDMLDLALLMLALAPWQGKLRA